MQSSLPMYLWYMNLFEHVAPLNNTKDSWLVLFLVFKACGFFPSTYLHETDSKG